MFMKTSTRKMKEQSVRKFRRPPAQGREVCRLVLVPTGSIKKDGNGEGILAGITIMIAVVIIQRHREISSSVVHHRSNFNSTQGMTHCHRRRYRRSSTIHLIRRGQQLITIHRNGINMVEYYHHRLVQVAVWFELPTFPLYRVVEK
mmetsp:Transcript_3882/g.7400  ORF Transcript_3882/g.7400 Transcript_3882/m.7400 type:complete len:146 (-) Transcript_3882:45-482(-)